MELPDLPIPNPERWQTSGLTTFIRQSRDRRPDVRAEMVGIPSEVEFTRRPDGAIQIVTATSFRADTLVGPDGAFSGPWLCDGHFPLGSDSALLAAGLDPAAARAGSWLVLRPERPVD